MRRLFILLAITISHLLLTKLVLLMTAARISGDTFGNQTSFISDMLIAVTKILAFPIISLILYPRQWYPGDLIIIPFFFNSLIWAIVIYGCAMLIKKIVLLGKNKT